MGFQQGLSGLNASAKHLDTIGNNVANASTVGFKQSQAQFADMFAASLSGSGVAQIGSGTSVAAVTQQFSQGNITTTNNPLDTAISGQGFFQLTDTSGATVYSRNGQFQMDKDGFLVNNKGHKVSGYNPVVQGSAALSPTTSPLKISGVNLPPKPSVNAVVGVNLNSAAAAVPATTLFSPTDPTSYTNSTSMSIYADAGASHIGTMYFRRLPITIAPAAVPAYSTTSVTLASTLGLSVGNTLTFADNGALPPVPVNATISSFGPAAGQVNFAALPAVPAGAITTNAPSSNWETYLTMDGISVPAAAVTVPPTAPTPLATLSFDASGKLISSTNGAGVLTTPTGTVVSATLFPNALPIPATAQTLTFSFGSPAAATTQFGGAFGVNTLTQDGYATGQLSSTSTAADGTITGRYSNGQTLTLGQIALANFANPQGLQPIGNNEWVQTAGSGIPVVGTPGTARLGVLQSSATEDSNVDLTAELVNMITAQRTYQANAQTIKTQDQLLQTIVSLR